MITRILITFSLISMFFTSAFAADTIDSNPNIRGISIGGSNGVNTKLEDFVGPINEFFYTPTSRWEDGILDAFVVVAFQIKNIVIILAAIFLIVSVLKLIFSPNSDEDAKKWRSSIIWTSVGVLLMQIVFSTWKTLMIQDAGAQIDGNLGWAVWLQIFAPIVWLLQMFAAFAFLSMAIYAFYTIITGGWDEEKLKKWKKTFMYGLIGFFLMRFPQAIIGSLYGKPVDGRSWNCGNVITVGVCDIGSQNLSGAVGIFWKIITYINGFLMLVCVILVIYAGWLVFISWGDEEKLKKAKSIILYVIIGFIVLIASHAIFRFFILQG